MGNQGHTRPGEFRKPLHEILPDLRKRVTRYTALTSGDKLRDGLVLAWGTADPGPNTGPHAGWAGLRLIKQDVAEMEGNNYLVHVYETIPATAEIQVGSNTQISLEDGRTGIEAEFLQFTAGTYAPGTVGTTTAPGDASAFLKTAEQTNDGTLRRIKRTYVYAGQIAQSDDTAEQGAVLTRAITSVKTTPSTPSGYTLIRTEVSPFTGLPVYHYTFVKGNGLVSVAIAMRGNGLRTETRVSYGTKSTPTGIVDQDDYREGNGYRIYTVRAWQTDTGGADPTTGTYNVQAYVPFTYPGRAKAFTEVYDTKTFLSTFLSPPVDTQVLATITITYQTSNTLGSIGTYWNPTDWATIKKQWVGAYGRASSLHEPLRGYRTFSSTPVTLGGGTTTAIDGSIIFGGTTARITVTGGPPNPDGNTYTLHAALDERPAFTSLAGVNYYRKTVVSATIPAQAALPV